MKAILVIDNVDCCGRCPILDRSFPFSCLYTGKVIHTDALCSHREKDCPLRPMPKKANVPDVDESSKLIPKEMGLTIAFLKGYNKCIDEILGENNESNTDS